MNNDNNKDLSHIVIKLKNKNNNFLHLVIKNEY